MHVGSVDELEKEQGIAHFVEHITFLGSRKRDNLSSMGGRSNAFTDFQHTLFHITCPTLETGSKRPLLGPAIDMLCEVSYATTVVIVLPFLSACAVF
jgi:secreted Zn-dependent insulinase-like peptidase